MVDAISATASLSDVGKLYQDNTQANLDTDAFLNAFDQGLGTLAKRPEFQEDVTMVDRLSGQYAGEVGESKADILAQSSAGVEEGSEANAQTLEERFQSLYFEMTHYQVAWKIAQNVQRDVSQVLRGS